MGFKGYGSCRSLERPWCREQCKYEQNLFINKEIMTNLEHSVLQWRHHKVTTSTDLCPFKGWVKNIYSQMKTVWRKWLLVQYLNSLTCLQYLSTSISTNLIFQQLNKFFMVFKPFLCVKYSVQQLNIQIKEDRIWYYFDQFNS